MLLVTQTDRLGLRLGDAEAIRLLCAAGFDGLDYSMFTLHDPEHPLNGDNWRAHAGALRRLAAGYGVPFRQAHAPFPSRMADDEEYNEITFRRIVRALEVTAALGAGTVVVHPASISGPEAMRGQNLEFFTSLQPYCREYGIRVALENMWVRDDATGAIVPGACGAAQDFCGYLGELDSRYFTACLDLGHCGLVGESAADAIYALGHDRLTALHVHDNDNLQDTHTAPFLGRMDWPAVAAALRGIDYAGDLTLEADNFFTPFPEEFLPTAAKFLHDTGRQLIAMIEGPQRAVR